MSLFSSLRTKAYSYFFSHMMGSQYLIGNLDKDRMKFYATSHGKFNFHATFPGGIHAPSAFPLDD